MSKDTNDSIRWGFLSTASIAASAYVPAIRESRNGCLHAVCSRSEEKAKAFADEYGFAKSYGSYEDLLADPEVDAIYNPLPVSLHAEWTIKALEAGKPVLCEKPLCRNAEEAREMVKTSRKLGLPLAEAVMYRLHPLTRKVRELLKAGAIGELRAVEANFHAVPDQKKDDNIRFRPELGGGATLDLGVYCVNFARFITGEEPVEIRAVGCIGAGSGVDEAACGGLRFPSGVLAGFSCSFRSCFESSYRLVGTKGKLIVPDGGFVPWPGGKFSVLHTNEDGTREIAVEPTNHYRLMAESFADTVRGKTEPEYPPEDAIRNMEVIDKILSRIR